MFKLPESWVSPDLIEDTQNLQPVFYDPASMEEFEAEFRTPEVQDESVISVSMRTAAFVGTAALLTAGTIGYGLNQPEEQRPEVSAEQIEDGGINNKNPEERTAEPMPILHEYKLGIPKHEPTDKPLAAVDLVDLGVEDGKYIYGIFDFDKKGKAHVVKLESEVPAEPTKDTSKKIVVPVSVVYTEFTTKDGKIKRVYSAVAGDDSGNAADTVKIDTDQASPEQKRLLQDKNLKKLVKDAVGLAAQDRVGYLTYDKAS